MMEEDLFQKNIDEFPWESKEQKEGYLALVQYKMKHGENPSLEVNLSEAFMIQKDHDSHVYWVEMVGNQISALQDQIKNLLEKI